MKFKDCTKCSLHKTRTQVVLPSGSVCSKIMCIGEAPGKNEDERGVPFIGSAGKLLDGILVDVGTSRKKVFVMNVLNCRPPNNRDPLPYEIFKCSYWLKKCIALVKPTLILTFGRYAYEAIVKDRIAENDYSNDRHVLIFSPVWSCFIYSMVHPSYALRNKMGMEEMKKGIEVFNKYVKENKNLQYALDKKG